MSERKRYHPLALVIYAFTGLKGWVFLFVLLLVNGDLTTTLGKWAVAAVLLFTAIQSVWKYLSKSYQISPEKILIYSGIFRKREIDIPYERIQTIKQRQWFFFKPFNVTQLLIETAGGSGAEAEASMPAVDVELLETIERYRHGGQADNEMLVSKDTNELTEQDADYRVTNGQIFLFGLTDLSILAPLLAIFVFVDEFIPENWVSEAASVAEQVWRAGWVVALGVIVLILLLVALISLAKTFFQYYRFKVTRNNQTLTIESGLFERHTQKIPLDKIQGLKIRQQPLRKLFGISSVELLLAGGQEKEGESGSAKKLYILPIISDRELYETLNTLLPEWHFNSPEIQYVSRNKLWYFLRWKLLFLAGALALGFIHQWLLAIGVLIMVVFLLDGWMESRFQGYALQSSDRVCVQTIELFAKVQTFVERPKVQSFSEHTSKWLFRKEIGHVKLFLKAGLEVEVVQLKFMDFVDVQKLKEFYIGKQNLRIE